MAEYNRDSIREKKKEVRINHNIKSSEVRLIDENAVQSVIETHIALKRAEELGLDLVEVTPGSEKNVPVVKMLDYGKFLYLESIRKKEAKKKQKIIVLKELYIHLGIAQHDYNVKLKQLKDFLSEGFKVKIGVKFRGREIVYSSKGIELLNRFYEDIGKDTTAKLEIPAKIEGNNAIIIFAPLVKI